jgi:hypothetical protein
VHDVFPLHAFANFSLNPSGASMTVMLHTPAFGVTGVDGLKLGLEDGLRLGIDDGLKLGLADGLLLGIADGLELGLTDGLLLGISDGL